MCAGSVLKARLEISGLVAWSLSVEGISPVKVMWCGVGREAGVGVAGDDARQTEGAARSSSTEGPWRMCGKN